MPYLHRDGVALYYEEAGKGAPPILLVHGFVGDRTQLAPQFEHFQARHRVVAVDRRGHGRSDKPVREYTHELFADDLAWMCDQLGLDQPVIVVHSLGGLGLEIARRHPHLPGALVLLDPPFFPPDDLQAMFEGALEGFRSPSYREVLRQIASSLFAPDSDEAWKARMLDAMATVPQHVMVSSWQAFLSQDVAAAAAACRVPLLCIASVFPADLARLRALCPQLVDGKAVGAGHWPQIDVPDQVNAMIERFLATAASARPAAAGAR